MATAHVGGNIVHGRQLSVEIRTTADIEFGIQLRDSDGNVLETVPHGRCWKVAIPSATASTSDWQA